MKPCRPASRHPLRRLLARAGAVGLVALVAGCIQPTPYAPATGGYGFDEAQIEQNRFRVSFRGNRATSRETVELYLLHRAAEVTLANGYDWFRIVSRSESEEHSADDAQATPEPARYRYRSGARVGFGFRYYGGPYYYPYPYYRFGYYPYYYYPYGYYPAYPVPVAEAEILAFKGTKPADDPDAYDAREVIEKIGPRLRRPAT